MLNRLGIKPDAFSLSASPFRPDVMPLPDAAAAKGRIAGCERDGGSRAGLSPHSSRRYGNGTFHIPLPNVAA